MPLLSIGATTTTTTSGSRGRRGIETEQVLDGRCRSVRSNSIMGSLKILHAGKLGRGNGLSLRGGEMGFLLVMVSAAASVAAAVSAVATSLSPLALDGTDNHLRPPELIDFGKRKVGDPVDAQVEGFDVGNILVGWLGDEVGPERTGESGHAKLERVLKDLVGRPSVLSRFGVVDVLPVQEDLALSTIEGPGENDLVLAPATVRTSLTVGYCGGIGDAELEGDSLFGKPKGLGGVFDTVVDLIGAEDIRHGGME